MKGCQESQNNMDSDPRRSKELYYNSKCSTGQLNSNSFGLANNANSQLETPNISQSNEQGAHSFGSPINQNITRGAGKVHENSVNCDISFISADDQTIKVYPGAKMKDLIHRRELIEKQNNGVPCNVKDNRAVSEAMHEVQIKEGTDLFFNSEFPKATINSTQNMSNNIRRSESSDSISVVGMDLLDVNYNNRDVYGALRNTNRLTSVGDSTIGVLPSESVNPFISCAERMRPLRQDDLWSTRIFPKDGKLKLRTLNLNKSLEMLIDDEHTDSDVKRYSSRSLPRIISNRVNVDVPLRVEDKKGIKFAKKRESKSISKTNRQRNRSSSAERIHKKSDGSSNGQRRSRLSQYYNLFPFPSDNQENLKSIIKVKKSKIRSTNSFHDAWSIKLGLKIKSPNSSDCINKTEKISDHSKYTKTGLPECEIDQQVLKIYDIQQPKLINNKLFSTNRADNIDDNNIKRLSLKHKSFDASHLRDVSHQTPLLISKSNRENRYRRNQTICNPVQMDKSIPEITNSHLSSLSLPTTPTYKKPLVTCQVKHTLFQSSSPTQFSREYNEGPADCGSYTPVPSVTITKVTGRQRSLFLHSELSARPVKHHSSSSCMGFTSNHEEKKSYRQKYINEEFTFGFPADCYSDKMCENSCNVCSNNHSGEIKSLQRNSSETSLNSDHHCSTIYMRPTFQFPLIYSGAGYRINGNKLPNVLTASKSNNIIASPPTTDHDYSGALAKPGHIEFCIPPRRSKNNLSETTDMLACGQQLVRYSSAHRLLPTEGMRTLTDSSSRFSMRKMTYEETKESAGNKVSLTDDLRIAPQKAQLNLSEDSGVSGWTSSLERNNSLRKSLEITVPGATAFSLANQRVADVSENDSVAREGEKCLRAADVEKSTATHFRAASGVSFKCHSEENIFRTCDAQQTRIKRSVSQIDVEKNKHFRLHSVAVKKPPQLLCVLQKVR